MPPGFVPLENGGFEYFDPSHVFVATIGPDGRVEVESQNPVDVSLCITVACVSVGKLRTPGQKRRRRSQLNPQFSMRKLERARYDDPNAPEHRGGSPGLVVAPLYLGLAFGRPPDPTAKLTRFLERTFEFRVGLAVRWQREQIGRALRELYGQLRRLWEAPGHTHTEKRNLIFELWLECDAALPKASRADKPSDVGQGSHIDQIRHKAARKARREIEGFVRIHAPVGSAHAYTSGELEQLKLRTPSDQTFAPYR
ncbi:MAG: hypothetical protein V3V08_14745 [Nannocystaceae bacterium]